MQKPVSFEELSVQLNKIAVEEPAAVPSPVAAFGVLSAGVVALATAA